MFCEPYNMWFANLIRTHTSLFSELQKGVPNPLHLEKATQVPLQTFPSSIRMLYKPADEQVSLWQWCCTSSLCLWTTAQGTPLQPHRRLPRGPDLATSERLLWISNVAVAPSWCKYCGSYCVSQTANARGSCSKAPSTSRPKWACSGEPRLEKIENYGPRGVVCVICLLYCLLALV